MLNIQRISFLMGILLILTLKTFPELVIAQSLDSEYSLEHYETTFRQVPSMDDPRWQAVPVEEWEKTFHFLADAANSNLERLLTWNASYNFITGSDLTTIKKRSSEIKNKASKIPSYYVMKQRYSFYRSNETNKSYISLVRQGDMSFYNDQYEKEKYENLSSRILIVSNLKAIITPDRLLTYEYDHDSRRSETLQQLGYEEFGKNCVVQAPTSMKISPIGAIFDPKFFYYQDLNSSYKYWSDLEHALLLELKAYLNNDDETVTKRIKVHRALIDDVNWFRIEHGITTKFGERLTSFYYDNSESGYCIVLLRFLRDGNERNIIKFEYENVNGVYIPKRFLREYYKNPDLNALGRRCFRYFDLVKAEVNKPIPDEQFVMDALGLDDDVVVYDAMDDSIYAYEIGKGLSEPIARFDDFPNGIKPRATSIPIWRSPVRMTALCLGLLLLVFGVIYKVRRKRASS